MRCWLVRTLFSPRRFEKYSKIVNMKSIDDAESSVNKLEKEFREADSRYKKVRIIRVLNQASNIAGVIANNMRISAPVRAEKFEISQKFRSSQRDLSRLLKEEQTTRID